jgi:predicted PhzF superfamily epimerase YddE/YHI9
MRKFLITLCVLGSATARYATAQPDVRIEPPANVEGPRVLEEQTATAVVRDYLQSWHSMTAALQQNDADLLDMDFAGTARDKLAETVQEQARLGLSAHYLDRAHDIQIVFISPDGLSIELTDRVEYDVQIFDHDKPVTSQHMRTRYTVVLTPAEARWKVRVFQGQI